MIAYVVGAFPQLSETFIELELAMVRERERAVCVVALRRPAPQHAGTTALPEELLAYVPGRGAVVLAFLLALGGHPVATTANVVDALRHRSKMMMRAAYVAPWVAGHLRRRGVRHLHAHFATDAGATAMAAARILGTTFSFTAHARDIYVRTRGLCLRCRRAAAVVTVCRYNVEQLRARCPDLAQAEIELVHCGVDVEALPLRDPPPPSPALRLLAVGRLVEKKGFGDLVAAVARLRGEGRDVRCEIIGDGPLREDLQARIDRAGIADSFRLLGARPPAAVAAALGECDAFVLPCVVASDGDRDSMPVVIKEAMARGVPVVSTREVAVPEMVDDEVGRLAAPGDPSSLAAAIAEVADLGEEGRRAAGLAGRRRVAARYDARVETDRLLELFDRIAR